MNKQQKYNVWYLVAAFVAMIVIQTIYAAAQKIDVIPYSEFQNDLKAGKVEEVRVSGNYIQGSFKQPDDKGRFRIAELPAGAWQVLVRAADGLSTLHQAEVKLRAGETKELQIKTKKQ